MKYNEKTLRITFEVGDIVDIHSEKTGCERLIAHKFNTDYLFEFFKHLASGQCGYGVSFHDWLFVSKGWEHIKLGQFKKIS